VTDPPKEQGWDQLRAFLAAAFSAGELRQWLATLRTRGAPLLGDLPGESVPLNHLIFATIDALRHRASIDADFWVALTVARPNLARQIRILQALFAMPPWPDRQELVSLCRDLELGDVTPPLALEGDAALYWLLFTAVHKDARARLARLYTLSLEFPCAPDLRSNLLRALDPAATVGGVVVRVDPDHSPQTPLGVDSWALAPDGQLNSAHTSVAPNRPTSVELGAEMTLELEIDDGRLRLRVAGSARSPLRGAKIGVWSGLRSVLRTLIPKSAGDRLGPGQLTYLTLDIALPEESIHAPR